MIIDLHTHTTASDGKLSVSELIQRAIEANVEVLSITDHDTVNAYHEINQNQSRALQLIPGVEFSTNWNKSEIHILGLNINLQETGLLEGIRIQSEHRENRARRIAEKLEKILKINDIYNTVCDKSTAGNIGRAHFARYLVTTGVVKDTRQAFAKYLGPGKRAYVKQQWAGFTDVLNWIHNAGGISVLAHPLKYQLTRTKLKLLLEDFSNAGGKGLEVVSGKQAEFESRKLAKVCNERNLLASIGSDFHDPEHTWCDIGKASPLPRDCHPVWEYW